MTKRPLTIYLAGKVSAHDWRHTLVTDLRTALNTHRQDLVCGDVSIPADWPVLPQAIFDTHHYVGPFFVACDHRCFHGRNSHGSRSGIQFIDEDEVPLRDRAELIDHWTSQGIVQLCLTALQKADLVFAWIETLDAYGTGVCPSVE